MQIQINDIHYTYPGIVKALNGITLNIQSGEKIALVGQNGSGKTTLARHLNGLLRPEKGSVQIGNWNTLDHSAAQMARHVAYVFQNPDEQLFHRQIWGEVAFGLQNLGYSKKQIHERVERALEIMGLSDISQHNPRDLGYSGRKRVTLASVIAMQTPIIVFDEPTTGLDAKEQKLLCQAISLLHREGKTILIISHDMDFLAENLDRFALLANGKIALDAPVQSFFKDDALLKTSGLSAPQITKLSQEMNFPSPAINIEQFLHQMAHKW